MTLHDLQHRVSTKQDSFAFWLKYDLKYRIYIFPIRDTEYTVYGMHNAAPNGFHNQHKITNTNARAEGVYAVSQSVKPKSGHL